MSRAAADTYAEGKALSLCASHYTMEETREGWLVTFEDFAPFNNDGPVKAILRYDPESDGPEWLTTNAC